MGPITSIALLGYATVDDVDNGSYDPDGDPITLDLNPPGPYPLGSTTVTLTVTDDSGATDSCEATVTVEDGPGTPPSITCPGDMVVECDGAGNSDQLNEWLASATATDNCDPEVEITNDFTGLSDGCGTTGTAEGMWTAEDDAGNTDSCSATFTVVDNTPPEITCPPDVLLVGLDSPVDPDVLGWAEAEDDCSGVEYIDHADEVVGTCALIITRTWTAVDFCGNPSTCEQTITLVPESVVTNTERCCFDCEQSEGDCGQAFRLLFTKDPQAPGCYKQTASNPGQYYYNAFADGLTPGVTASFTITLPYPFVTQGAQPVHAYDGAAVNTDGPDDGTCPASTCFTPGNEIYVEATPVPVTLDSYAPQAMGSTTTVDVMFTVPQSGLVFVAIHLDYGLKGTHGYQKGAYDDAVDCETELETLIPNLQPYEFEWYGWGGQDFSSSVCNFNVFKNNPGVGGMSLKANGNPLPGGTAMLMQSMAYGWFIIDTAVPDEDGYYMINYAHKGRPAIYRVRLDPPPEHGEPQHQDVLLRARHFVEVNFTTPPSE